MPWRFFFFFLKRQVASIPCPVRNTMLLGDLLWKVYSQLILYVPSVNTDTGVKMIPMYFV